MVGSNRQVGISVCTPSFRARWGLIITLLAGWCGAASAQTADRPNRGLSPVGSYSVSDIERVNLTNGNVTVTIPLASLPPIAGGKLAWTLSAIYNSKLWDTSKTQEPAAGIHSSPYVVTAPQLSDLGGWRIGSAYSLVFRESRDDFNWLPPHSSDPEYIELTSYPNWYKTILETPDGARHELRPTDYQPYLGDRDHLRGYYRHTPQSVGAPMRYYSVDGSFLWATVYPTGSPTSWVVYQLDGTRIVQSRGGIQRIYDTNGNSIKSYWNSDPGAGLVGRYFVDEQTGREIRYVYNPAGGGGNGQYEVQYQAVGGTWVTIEINFGTTTVRGKMYEVEDYLICSPLEQFLQDTDLSVMGSIVLPQTQPGVPRQQFSFSYNSDGSHQVTHYWQPTCPGSPQPITMTASNGWGALSQMVTPRGATASYSYSLDSTDSLTLPLISSVAEEAITSKSVTHDSTSDTWTYNIISGSAGAVTNPDGTSVSEAAYVAATPGLGGLVYRTSQSGKVVVERHWRLLQFTGSNSDAPGGTVTFNPVVDAEYTTLVEGSSNVKMSAKTFLHDYNGNVIQETCYDWFDPALVSRDSYGVPTGVPASATVLRVTNNTYYHQATAAGSANVYAKRATGTATPLVLNAPQETTVGASQTRLSYDGQAYGAAPTVGNLTRVSSWKAERVAMKN